MLAWKGPKEFHLAQVMEILEVGKPTLESWLHYVKPSTEAHGTGSRNIFSLEDLLRLAFFRHLIKGGFPRREAMRFIEGSTERHLWDFLLRYHSENPLAPVYQVFIREGEKSFSQVIFNLEGFVTFGKDVKNADDAFLVNARKIISLICYRAGVKFGKREGKTLLTDV